MRHVVNKSGNALLLFSWLLLGACPSGESMNKIADQKAQLTACPSSPNCVSSDAEDAKHRIEPFRPAVSAAETLSTAQAVLTTMPRTKVVAAESDYLHVECRSKVFGFIDDLELHIRAKEGLIAVRSAARLGYFDFGVNRKRVEKLRSELIARGVLEKAR